VRLVGAARRSRFPRKGLRKPFYAAPNCPHQKEYSLEENNMRKHLADEPGPILHGCHMIRQAVPDDAITVVPLILQAIGHIAFVLSGTNDDQETTSILTNFFCQEDNRISYQNTLVMEQDGVVV
jgi:hypothetical protein